MTTGRTVLHQRTHPDWYWTTTNAAEAIPGVLTPLGWSLWGPCGERTMRRVFYEIGGLPKSVLEMPADERDRVIGVFFGRIAINVDTFVRIGNAMPGAKGTDLADQMLGYVPDELPTGSTWRRYPIVLAKFPPVFLRMPGRAKQLCADTGQWYRSVIGTVDGLNLDAARRLFRAARARFDEAVYVQTLNTTTGIQPIFQQLTALATKAEVDPSTLMVGHGSHAETQLVQDCWDCSRGQLGLDDLVARHGFHGPGEGHVHGTVWRQDRGPLERVLETYRAMPDHRDPARESARNTAARQAAERQLLSSLSALQRPGARLVLRLAERYLPLRGGCKAAFLQSLDVCRAASRRMGDLLAEAGMLEAPDDIFYLTCDELLGEPPSDVGRTVEARRAERDGYLDVEIPVSWRGDPEPVMTKAVDRENKLEGIGVSAGEVTGRAQVVTDPADVEMDIGDILVACTTDPSWASVMYPAGALVVEIGGQLSHAAVIARELGIPCVMGIRDVTKAIRTGDLVRVDGTAGTIEVVQPASG
ncbi:MAG TPA: PEP-utilizing enzyme [Acidimicrobiia bacterium]|jgi:pyruvate,water dikinase|nr:PEP-utilizing enzyme [Acidimicrobiia bacterium]